jgi:hypothetical protein
MPQHFRLSSADQPPDGRGGTRHPLGGFPLEGEDLPYRVELLDEAGEYVEQVVAVSLSPAIGYAAYYAAAKEYPDRTITLRHKGQVLSRWTSQPN